MTGSETGTIRVWETEGPGSLTNLRTLEGHR